MRLVLVLFTAFTFICSPAFAAGDGSGVSADKALIILKEGNHRFITGNTEHPSQDSMTRDKTATKGQHPFAIVLSCSDSRVPVEILFDQGVGDIFVIRVAGNVANVDEVASSEYAADHLNVPLLVVLGHSKCGAVTAVVENQEAHGSIPYLVKSIVPAVNSAKKHNPNAKGEALLEAAIRANVLQAMSDLFQKSPIITDKVKNNKLKVVGGYYHLDTGKITWLGEHPNQAKFIGGSAVKGH